MRKVGGEKADEEMMIFEWLVDEWMRREKGNGFIVIQIQDIDYGLFPYQPIFVRLEAKKKPMTQEDGYAMA